MADNPTPDLLAVAERLEKFADDLEEIVGSVSRDPNAMRVAATILRKVHEARESGIFEAIRDIVYDWEDRALVEEHEIHLALDGLETDGDR